MFVAPIQFQMQIRVAGYLAGWQLHMLCQQSKYKFFSFLPICDSIIPYFVLPTLWRKTYPTRFYFTIEHTEVQGLPKSRRRAWLLHLICSCHMNSSQTYSFKLHFVMLANVCKYAETLKSFHCEFICITTRSNKPKMQEYQNRIHWRNATI